MDAGDVEGDALGVGGLGEADEDARFGVEVEAADGGMRTGDRPCVSRRVDEAGHGGHLIAVLRRAQARNLETGDCCSRQGGEFEWSLGAHHLFTVQPRLCLVGFPIRPSLESGGIHGSEGGSCGAPEQTDSFHQDNQYEGWSCLS